jgi:hypothetical protein
MCTKYIIISKTTSNTSTQMQRGNCGRCQHRRHHCLLQFQLDSDVCSADLQHNPRKDVGLHAHQRLHRLPSDGLSGRPRTMEPWYVHTYHYIMVRTRVPHRDWRRRPTPRSKWRSTPTKTTSSRLSLRQVVASTKQPETGLML